MTRWTRALGLLCLVAATSVGCRAVGEYAADRGKDFVDIVGFDFYWGQGMIAQGQLTKIAQVGVGSFDGDILKVHRRAVGHVEEVRSEGGMPFYYFTVYDRVALGGNETFKEQHSRLTGLGEVHYNLTDPNDRGFYEIGGRLAVFIGAGVTLDIYQVLDFATGWFGLDMGRDDYRNRNRKPVAHPRYRSAGEAPISDEV